MVTVWPRSVSGHIRELLNTVGSDVQPSCEKTIMLLLLKACYFCLPYLVMLDTEKLGMSCSTAVKVGMN